MKDKSIEIWVNENKHSLSIRPQKYLIHVLRDDLNYTGPTIGCQNSTCGECTVQMNGESVKSCTMVAARADGAEIYTDEGANSNLDTTTD